MRALLVATFGVIALGLVWWAGWTHAGAGLLSHQTVSHGDVVCVQVVTSARDPKTGYIKQFPTPCDVPAGWEVIQNDVPGL